MTDPLELSISRRLDAPRAAVWRAFTEHLAEWWCPAPWTTEVIEQDWRAGGRSALVLRGPDGESQSLEGVVLEIVPAERFVFTNALTVGWRPQAPFMVGVFTFADEDGGTRYTASARHWTAEGAEQHLAMGFEAGWTAVALQLEAVARRLAG